MWHGLPDDLTELVLEHYRRHLRRGLVHRALRRAMRPYRKALDSTHPFYTAERKRIILVNSLLCAHERGDVAILGPGMRALRGDP